MKDASGTLSKLEDLDLNSKAALMGSGLLLVVLIIGVSLAAYTLTPQRGAPSSTVVVASNPSTNLNGTTLLLSLKLPNGTRFTSASVAIGPYFSVVANQSYYFKDAAPGTYSFNMTGAPNYVLPATVKLAKGANYANLTVYPLQTIALVEGPGLQYNDTQPGPPIFVRNSTAVKVQIFNNSSQINDFAVVSNLNNFSAPNVLFSSVSETLLPGGSTNATFIVDTVGSLFYTSLIASQAKAGQYGYFYVT